MWSEPLPGAISSPDPRASRVARPRSRRETGAALVSALFVLVLMAGLTAGLTVLLITDVKMRALDGTRTQAFYVAHAGIERLTASLGDLFETNYAPSGAQIDAPATTTPGLGATWLNADGTNGYTITYPKDGSGNPSASVMTVLSGPFQGLVGLAVPYVMAVTAKVPDGSEASLTRTLQTVSIPVFQFGFFSENDLSFFAGPNFAFGGRVHTNSNLYLASGDGSALTMADRVTSVGEIIRTNLSNGWPLTTNYNGTVNLIQVPGSYRPLATNEGSLVGAVGSAQNEPAWTNLSTGTYNHNVANGRTGAKRLDLPLVSFGAQPIDLIRRPVTNENVSAPLVLAERYFSQASVRILLSDSAAEITGLPGVSATAPIQLSGAIAGYTVDATHAPLATSPGSGTTGVFTPAGTSLLGGFLKIERQTPAGVWQDVTLELLNLGIADKMWPDPATGSPAGCADPTPNAVVRFERLLDNASCFTAAQLLVSTNYLPNTLYDTREGILRDNVATGTPIVLGGIMHYISLDVNNLRRWILGQIGTTGTNTMNVTGYTVYFSDRRGNKNAANQETGEYGFEDFVNPASASGTPNGVRDTGEDLNGNGQLDMYGQTPILGALIGGPYTAAARPWSTVEAAGNTSTGQTTARRNPPIFFRRALKLVNGALGNIIAPGMTVASENPVYIQGNWNATSSGFSDPHVATAVLADAVTLLSSNWSDRNSFLHAQDRAQRTATTTWYRVGVIAGKGVPFPQPTGTGQDYGTDGGAHNFLRYLEDWAGQTLNYRGSIVSFFTSRQAVGTYKCCNDVYGPPTRGYNFDADFLTPALLPPRTPMFRDVNTTGFSQIIRAQ